MNKTDGALTITDVNGPFREPREPAFSYDYAIQRPTWATPFAVRVKVALADELDVIKGMLMGSVTGSPGQQLMLNRLLTRQIADEKLRIADQEGLLSERRDVLVDPFAGPLAHFFPELKARILARGEALRTEIKRATGL